MIWNDVTRLTFGNRDWKGVGVSPSEQYREYAAECLRLAQSAANEDDRARLVGMAQAWRELAGKLEKEEGK